MTMAPRGISIGYEKRSSDLHIGHCVAKNNPGNPSNLTNHSGNGIVVGNAQNVIIEYCEAANNGWDMPRKGNGPVGIWAWNSDRVIIQFCVSHDNKSPGDDGGGFDFDGGVTNSILQYNHSYNNHGPGYFICQYPGAPAVQGQHHPLQHQPDDGGKNNRRSGIEVHAASQHLDVRSTTTRCTTHGPAVGSAACRCRISCFATTSSSAQATCLGRHPEGPVRGQPLLAHRWRVSFDGHHTLEWAAATGQEKTRR